MMRLLFTTSDKPMAKLIRWATGEDCSHTAIQWDDLVVHSNIKGVNIMYLSDFLKENRIIHTLPLVENKDKLTDLIVRSNTSLYDIGALLFLGVVLFCRKALNITKWPKMNLWQSSGMYLCTEFVTEYTDGKTDSLITPYKLFKRMEKQQNV